MLIRMHFKLASRFLRLSFLARKFWREMLTLTRPARTTHAGPPPITTETPTISGPRPWWALAIPAMGPNDARGAGTSHTAVWAPGSHTKRRPKVPAAHNIVTSPARPANRRPYTGAWWRWRHYGAPPAAPASWPWPVSLPVGVYGPRGTARRAGRPYAGACLQRT